MTNNGRIRSAPVYFIEVAIPVRHERKSTFFGEIFEFIIQWIEIVKNNVQKNDRGTSTMAY